METTSAPTKGDCAGTREVRHLPFEADTFETICKKMHIHGSISRVISRADVPFFSRSYVEMGGQAAIGMFEPQCGLTRSCGADNAGSLQL